MTIVQLRKPWRDRQAGMAEVPDGAIPALIEQGYCDPPRDDAEAELPHVSDKAIPPVAIPVAFICDVCGGSYRTPAGLGAHKYHVHRTKGA